MADVGLDYLTIDRRATTLSGGESQRIRLATQIGSRLMGVLYILDEPSIGLHQRDNGRLIRTLLGMRDIGNTVIVVEHDAETMRQADWILDLGPGAGEHGGQVVCSAALPDVLALPDVAHRGLPARRPPDPHARGAPAGRRQVPRRRRRDREQPERGHRPLSSSEASSPSPASPARANPASSSKCSTSASTNTSTAPRTSPAATTSSRGSRTSTRS